MPTETATMSGNPSNESRSDPPDVDNWPIEGKSREDVEWIGTTGGGGGGSGAPSLYEPHNDVVYQANIDEENERLVPDPETERRVSEDQSLGDVLKDIADSSGWQSLSSFASEHFDVEEDDSEIRTEGKPFADRTFQERNVRSSADHQAGFFGSTTYETDEGVETIEHEFHVYTDDDQREDGKPTAEIEETRLHNQTVEGAMQGGDAEIVGEDHHEAVLDVDPDLSDRMEHEEIEERCRRWHEDAVTG